VVYTSKALLSALLAIVVVRSIIAGISWVAMGRSLWLFPYLLSEVRVPILDSVTRGFLGAFSGTISSGKWGWTDV
jgi:hypothetical protein